MNTNRVKGERNAPLRRSTRVRTQISASLRLPLSTDDNDSPAIRSPRKRTRRHSRSKFQDVTNSTSRKRSASSDDDTILSSKKLRKSPKTPPSNHNAVTPITAASKPSRSEMTFHLPPRQPAASDPSMPEGVVNLYPGNSHYLCVCDDDHCSSQSQSHCFLRHYGKQFNQSLKDWELIHFPSPAEHDRSDASSSSETQSIASSHVTPVDRVAYIIHGSVVEEDTVESAESQLVDHQPHLTEKMRAVLIDWLIELSEEYKIHTRTLHLTIALLNRALQCGKEEDGVRKLQIEREEFQCLGCTCMWMACKIEEITPPTIEDFVYISADSYDKQEIAEMEVAVCGALQFKLWQVTPHDYVDEFLRASMANRHRLGCISIQHSLEHSMVQYLLELSMIPYSLVKVSPRKICAAAVYLARIVLGIDGGWTPTLEHYSGYTKWDLEDVALTIHKYHWASEQSSLKNAFIKFSKEKYHSVALKTVPREEDLEF